MVMEMVVDLSNQNVLSLNDVKVSRIKVPPEVNLSPFYFKQKSHIMSNIHPLVEVRIAGKIEV